MKMYYDINNPSDIRDLESIMEAWIQANNPKANSWTLVPSKPNEYAVWGNGEWVVPSQQEINNIIDTQNRATQRSLLKQQWDSLPAYIKGPYRPEFEAANRMLDEGDDESAIAMIQYAPAKPDFTQDQITVFNNVKQQMIDGIASLTRLKVNLKF